jgi:hypothetical protein
VWGSPDIERDIDFVVALPRKKPFTMKLRCLREPERAKPKAERRPQVSRYLADMKDAADLAALVPIGGSMAIDETLTPSELEFLRGQMKRRAEQLDGAS